MPIDEAVFAEVTIMSGPLFRLVPIRPQLGADWESLCRQAGLDSVVTLDRRYGNISFFIVVDFEGLPIWGPTMFLAKCAGAGRGITEDTPRTYGECVVAWLDYLVDRQIALESVTEEVLQGYRACLVHSRLPGRKQCSTATANLRVTVAALFHVWAEKNAYSTPLGRYLTSDRDGGRQPFVARRIKRHPRVLSADELTGIFQFVRQPYKLAFRWALTTGMRRVEVAALRVSALPSAEALLHSDDGLAQLTIIRKGGTEWSVYAPVQLIEETQWHIFTERQEPLPDFEDVLFISRLRRPLSRQCFSREFQRCAKLVGSDATMHHLRHTYAVNVLRYLDSVESGDCDKSINSLKTLQVLMGHARSETTEIYLTALSVSHPSVVEALGYLYGVAHDI